MEEIKQKATWHHKNAEEVFRQLDSGDSGLSSSEAEQRISKWGLNQLTPPKKKGPLLRFLAQFHNVLIYVLIGAGLLTLVLQHWVDSGVIFGVVVINAIIGFIQEGKAEKALEAIRNLMPQQAFARRDGKFVNLAAENLVPGDVVLIQSGDKVPADLRLFKTKELRIEEAMLTGESLPASKSDRPVAVTAGVGDRRNIAHSGTLVTFGQGYGVVVETGDSTEIGRISGMLTEVETLTTPLLRQVAEFSRLLTIAIIVLAVFAFAYGMIIWGNNATEMFLASVGLAVAAIPEGLPAIMTITLAIGVQRMAKRNAIIRRLPAVETLGAITVICSDKTGTLTRNEMTVQSVATAEEIFEVSGVGYDPHGEFSYDGETLPADNLPLIKEVARAAMLCNDAELYLKDDQWQMQGDPTEGSLITFALKAGFDQVVLKEQCPRTDVIPFESQHKFMATLHHDHVGHAFVFVKGAPERILEMCNFQRMRGEDTALDQLYWEKCMEALAGRGQRLLAIAFKTVPVDQRDLSFDHVQGGLTLLGIAGIIDPPRIEAIEAVKACRSAGIRVKMITGDHAATASAIARQMGIGDDRESMRGVDLERLDDEALKKAVNQTDVFARTSPENKLKLVTAIQANGDVVAMTGDGVNDAPALKRADVGVAMGQKGTEAAKEAAEMVLADDNFASIAHAVEEGRTVYDNLTKSIVFVLPTNGGEALIVLAAILFGTLLPITAVQILWVNMITAVTLALTLAFEPSEKNVMERLPRDPKAAILSPFLIWRIASVSLVLLIGTLVNFYWEKYLGGDINSARTVAVNTLVVFEIFYLFNCRFLYASSFNKYGFSGNRTVPVAVGILIIVQILFTYTSPFQFLFETAAIDGFAWLRILLIGSTVFFLVELEKKLTRRHRKQPPHRPHGRALP